MKPDGGFLEVCVVDIIMNPEHEYFKSLGGWDACGTIFWKHVTRDNVDYETKNPQENTARPFFANQKYYPLINERVLIFSAITKDVLSNKGKDGFKEVFYYLPNLNLWNHPHHNALPYIIEKPEPETNPPANYNLLGQFKKAVNGIILRQPKEGENSPALGEYFKENPTIKPLLPYEGDHIIEGRFGNSIRFGSTVPFEPAGRFKNSIQPIPNIWSELSLNGVSKTHPNGKGQVGDPIIIIRNEQPTPRNSFDDPKGNDKKGWIPTTENINKDGSSIYITSNQLIPIEVAGSRRKSDALISNDSYDHGAKVTQKELLTSTYEYVEGRVEDFVDDVTEFLSDPIEYLAPTPEPIEFAYDTEFDDGQNDFSFVDELIATGQYDDDDFEYAAVSYENTEISGTELEESEIIEMEKTPPKQKSNGGKIESAPTVKREAYVKGADGIPRIEGTAQYNKWVDDYKAGTTDYPFLYVNPRGGDYALDVVVNPKPVERLIDELKAEGVNGTNFPEYQYLCLHVTATSYRSNHELMNYFMTSDGGWRRPGYHISVDDKGLCNYNVNFKSGESHGAGGFGNAFGVSGGVGGLFIGGGKGGSANCINISWIGSYAASHPPEYDKKGRITSNFTGVVANQELAGSDKSVNYINVTPIQAYAYCRLCQYFLERFPKLKLIGHNQTSITGGYGKSCPMFDPITFATNIGYEGRAWPKHICDYTEAEKRKFKNFSKLDAKGKVKKKNGVLFSNFGTPNKPYYANKNYKKAAQYFAVLGGNDPIGTDYLQTDFA